MYITMLGVGNGFSRGVHNNNALLECEGQRALIDCGVTAWESLAQLGMDERDIGTIVLTHIHFDHAGGLEAAALHCRYFFHHRLRLVVPAPLRSALWDEYLRGSLYNPAEGCLDLEDYFDVDSPKEGETFTLCGSMQATWFPTKHIPGKFSCGILVEGMLAYTSDMRYDPPLMERLLHSDVQWIFHDCQIGDASVHASYSDILTYPEQAREKLILMHHGLLVPPADAPIRFAVQHDRMNLESPKDSKCVEEDTLVQRTAAFLHCEQLNETTGHDWYHTQRVYETAMRLARMDPRRPNLQTVALAALLHDIKDWKFHGGDEEAGPSAAADWLETCGADQEQICAVQTIIRDLSFKGMGEVKRMGTAEGEIVQDADRLDAMGAIGVARAFATGAALGNALLDPALPPRQALRREEYSDRKVRSTTVNHFYEKLLHLEELMNTPAARAEAQERHRYMLAYLQTLFRECGMTHGIHQHLLEEYYTQNNQSKKGGNSA